MKKEKESAGRADRLIRCVLTIVLSGLLLISALAQKPAQQPECRPWVDPFPGTRESLFGIKLRPDAVRLLEQVEKRSKKRVHGYLCADTGAGRILAAPAIDAEGNLYIALNEVRALDEASIVHELFHLKFVIEGFPMFKPCPSPDQSEEVSNYLGFAGMMLGSSIQHWMFFPRMREMGLKPEEEHGAFDAGSDLTYTTKSSRREERILSYCEAALTMPNQANLDHLKKWYLSKGWIAEQAIAQEMVNVVIKMRPSSPESFVRVMKRCLEILSQSGQRLRLGDANKQDYGTYKTTTVCINISPGK